MPIYEAKKTTKDGRKYFFSCYYKDKYGKSKKYKSKLFLGKRECERAERKFLEETERKDLTDYDITFEDMYNDWWQQKRKRLKSTTAYSIKVSIDNNVFNELKEYKLHSIKINVVNEVMDKIIKKDIAISYKNKMLGYLREILMYAVMNYDFDIKVASKVQKIRNEAPKNTNYVSDNYWTLEEFNKFISVVDDSLWFVLFNFLYYTGVRIGELMALNWNDVDFNRKTVSISKTLSNKIGIGRYLILEPKTQNSVRVIDLDDNLMNLLIEHFYSEKKLYYFEKKMFIFGNIRHIPLITIARAKDKYINKYNSRKEEKDKLKRITLHGFRHSHASLLINLGLDFKDVADRLGHTPEICQKVYYHLFPQKKSNTVNALNELNKRM